jgi:hypothetical protein
MKEIEVFPCPFRGNEYFILVEGKTISVTYEEWNKIVFEMEKAIEENRRQKATR